MSKLFWKGRDHLGCWTLDIETCAIYVLFHIFFSRNTNFNEKGATEGEMDNICGPEIAKQFKNLAMGEMFLQ